MALNLQAPECNSRICLQQGPYLGHPDYIADPYLPCDESWCRAPYGCVNRPGLGEFCLYRIKGVCTRECRVHEDCRMGKDDANHGLCSRYVCRTQPGGEAFSGHCICVCKDFLVNPTADPPRYYLPDEMPEQPSYCR